MTEYDYSPEAYERAMSTRHRIARWVDDCEDHSHEFASENEVGGRDPETESIATVKNPGRGRDRQGPVYLNIPSDRSLSQASLLSPPAYDFESHARRYRSQSPGYRSTRWSAPTPVSYVPATPVPGIYPSYSNMMSPVYAVEQSYPPQPYLPASSPPPTTVGPAPSYSTYPYASSQVSPLYPYPNYSYGTQVYLMPPPHPPQLYQPPPFIPPPIIPRTSSRPLSLNPLPFIQHLFHRDRPKAPATVFQVSAVDDTVLSDGVYRTRSKHRHHHHHTEHPRHHHRSKTWGASEMVY